MHVARFLTRRSIVAVTAVGAIAAVALPAGAATTTTPSHGRATSTLTILQLRIAGQRVTAGRISAVAGNASSPHVAKLVLTPLDSTATGPIGQQTITPSSGSTTVPSSPGSVNLPGGLGNVTGPTFIAEAKDGAAAVLATAKLSALGKVTLAGVPLNLKLASLADTAQIVSTNATAEKSFSLGGLALPSIADLLASLGLDLNGLLDQLTQGKLTQLAGIVTSTTAGAVKTANDAVDAAQTQVQAAGGTPAATLTAAQAQKATTDADAATADTAFSSAWSTAFGLLLGPAQSTLSTALGFDASTMTAAQFDSLVQAAGAGLTALTTAFGSAEVTTLETLAAAAVAADALATAVNALVDALQALVNAVLNAVNADGDPLASLGGLKVTTKAVAARTPAAAAGVSVATIDVLGQAQALSALTGALAGVGATLSSVLNSVPGVTFTPPSIAVGKPTHSTKTVGTTRYASASVTGVTVTLPTLALAAPALPLALPGGLNSGAGSLVLGALTESAQWTPSSTVTSGSPVPGGGRQLGDTGGRALLPILATLILGLAVAVRRRWSAA